MKIAITGANGFIGSHVVSNAVDDGHDVVALGRHPEKSSLQPFRLTDGTFDPDSTFDLCDLIEGVDAVIHLAGQSSLDRSTGWSPASGEGSSLHDYWDANVRLTEKVLNAACVNGVKNFVFSSSRLVYSSTLSRPRTEEMDCRPASPYGLSKVIAENLVQMYADSCEMKGISLRLGQVVGPGDNTQGILPLFIRLASEGKVLTVMGKGRAVRDFVDVRDVSRALLLAAGRQIDSCRINIGGGGFSIRQLAETVIEASGTDSSRIESKPTENEDLSNFSLDCSLAKQVLEWEPQMSLKKIIEERL